MRKSTLIKIVLSFIVLNCFAVKTINAQNDTPKSKLFYTPDYKFRFFGRISADGAINWNEKTQNVSNGATLSQLAIGGIFSFGERMEGKLELDFANGQLTLLDNFITYNFTKEYGLRMGNIQEPFSMDLLNSFKDLSMMNRAQVVNALAPGHHIGMMGTFENQQWLIHGGLFFQRSMNINQKATWEANYAKGINEGYSATARMVWMPQNDEKTKGLHFGIAGSYRTPKTDTSTEVTRAVHYSQSANTVNKIRFTDTGTITDVDFSWLAGAEFSAYNGPFKFQAEYIHNGVNRMNGLPNEQFSGFYVQAFYLLLGGQQDYNNSRGAYNLPKINNDKGDIEVMARFDRLDLNGESVKGGSSNQITVGVNYYINENIRFMLNYAYLTHDKYADANGEGKGDNKYNTLTARVQLRF